MLVEIEIVPIADELEHPLKSFKEELEEFFEQWGWKVLKVSNYDNDEE